jgi:hypothetical protein
LPKGWIESVEAWLEIRKLRNQMVHAYIEDLALLTSALQSGHNYVSTLVVVGQKMMAQASLLLSK